MQKGVAPAGAAEEAAAGRERAPTGGAANGPHPRGAILLRWPAPPCDARPTSFRGALPTYFCCSELGPMPPWGEGTDSRPLDFRKGGSPESGPPPRPDRRSGGRG